MSQVIVPRDAQGVVIEWLHRVLPSLGADVAVYSITPAVLPDRFVKVIRTGGTDSDVVIDSPTLEVESYVKGSDDSRAFTLAGLVRGAVHAMDGESISGAQVYGVSTGSGPANLPDPTLPTYQRVRQMFQIDVRMQVVDL